MPSAGSSAIPGGDSGRADVGLDAVNPVQISCNGMDAAELKRKYSGRITFWGGGCDTRDILPKVGPEEVRRHVQEQCRILNPGGGFVFQQVHNIMANVPPENIVAMFDAIRVGRAGCQAHCPPLPGHP